MSNGRPDFSYVSKYAFYFLGAFIQYIFIAKDTGIGIVNDFFREMEFWEKTLECVQHDKYLYCDLANEEYKERVKKIKDMILYSKSEYILFSYFREWLYHC